MWHLLVASAFVIGLSLLVGLLPLPYLRTGFWWLWALLATVGMFLRELAQVDWRPSRLTLHKHAEWAAPGLASFVVAFAVGYWLGAV